jgi:hypothetical protein
MPFVKGQSGNPAGRPVGSRNKFTSDMHEALEKAGPALLKMLVDEAIDGKAAAMRQCLDRLMGKHRPSSVQLPAPDAPNYVMTALTEIYRALGAGEIASDEAARLVDLVGRTARVLAGKAAAEIDFAARLARVEEVLVAMLKADTARRRQETAGAAAPGVTTEPVIETSDAETAAETTPPTAPALTEPGVIDNNNGNTMSPAPAPGEALRSPADTRPPARNDGTDQTMTSIGPPAPLADAA